MEKCKIILASSSPRRRTLFDEFNLKYSVVVPDIEETRIPGEKPIEFVKRIAGEKALNAATKLTDKSAPSIIVAADTIVVLDNEILGKPKDSEDAVKMLKRLSGKTHKVITGWAAGILKKNWIVEACITEVTFYPLTENEIIKYVETKEPLDKAGAYGIQEKGGALVKEINGSYFNVVGLPMEQLLRALKELNGIDEIFVK